MKKLTNNLIVKFKNNLLFYRKLLNDPQTPKISKIFLSAAIAYVLSPIDLIPDFIPVLGYIDDLIIVPSLVSVAIWFIPKCQIEKIKRELNT
jgi:uncharacterized membrane protein YkvA (DUF1232 family)